MKKNRFFLVVLLFFWVFPTIHAISANSPTFNIYLKQGLDAFQAREYNIAYESLLKAFDLAPGNYAVNFHLGRAAFENNNYEMAIMVFERALMINPNDLRVKLEMARAYQKLGINDMARKYCNEVLLTDPPQAVKQNIEKFLAYIDRSEQQHFFRGSISMGFDWNDNVWASPANNIIQTNLGEVTLTGPSSQAKEDFIYSAMAQLNHTYSFSYSNFVWQSKITGYKALYNRESDLDTLYLAIETGPEYSKGKGVAGFSITSDYLNLAESKYSSSLGAKTFYRYMFTPSLIISPNLEYKNLSFEQNSKKNSDNFSFSIDGNFLLKKFWIGTSLGYEHETAADDEYSYNRGMVSLSINRELFYGLTAFGSYEFYHTRYDGIPDLFDQARRDSIHYAGCGLKKRLWQSSDRRQSIAVSLGYQYIKALSYLDLYEYNKNIVNSSLEYRF
jgi:tetratricopeptide (TPR) repeat protein